MKKRFCAIILILSVFFVSAFYAVADEGHSDIAPYVEEIQSYENEEIPSVLDGDESQDAVCNHNSYTEPYYISGPYLCGLSQHCDDCEFISTFSVCTKCGDTMYGYDHRPGSHPAFYYLAPYGNVCVRCGYY